MIQIPTAQAMTELDKILLEIAQGKDIVLIGTDDSAFKLVALPRKPEPIFGSAKGLVHIGPDFDDLIEMIDGYIP